MFVKLYQSCTSLRKWIELGGILGVFGGEIMCISLQKRTKTGKNKLFFRHTQTEIRKSSEATPGSKNVQGQAEVWGVNKEFGKTGAAVQVFIDGMSVLKQGVVKENLQRQT